MIRPATPADAAAIAAIYNHFVTNTTVTFEEEPVSSAEMTKRIENVSALSLPWLVAETEGAVAGYAYAARWHHRHGYRFSVEVTVYLGPAFGGRGLGSRLYQQLFPVLEQQGTRVVMGVIALPNEASIALHEKFGLEKVGHFKGIGMKFGEWIDVGYWQRTFPG